MFRNELSVTICDGQFVTKEKTYFYGFRYDLVLLAPTRSALQRMMSICEDYANRHNLVFSTHPSPAKSKTKCLLFRLDHREDTPVPILLNGLPLPWVEHATHLGHEFHTSGAQDMDCNMKRGAYIGETIELLNVFQHAHPLQKLVAIQTYACSFYGSNLFDLYGPAACQLYRAWQVSVRDAWSVPRQTRTYIVDHLLAGPLPHIRQLILRRFVKYVKVLVSSMNPVISGLAYWGTRTRQSSTGRNVANIRDEFRVDPMKCFQGAIKVVPREIPAGGEETLELLDRLLSIRANEVEPDIVDELTDLINDVVT